MFWLPRFIFFFLPSTQIRPFIYEIDSHHLTSPVASFTLRKGLVN